MDLSQYEIIGYIVIALISILTLYNFFSSATKRNDSILNELKLNLQENTLTLKALEDLLKSFRLDTEKEFKRHEQRLDRIERRQDEQGEAIIKLNSYKDINIKK